MTRFATVVVPVVLWVAAGCNKTAEPEFVEAYVTAFCQFSVDCADPVEVAFDGAPTVEDCRAVTGPAIAEYAQGCKIVKDAAEVCIADLEAAECPASGPPEAAVPASCDAAVVWKKCDEAVVDDA